MTTVASTVQAVATPPNTPTNISIEAQPLASALQEFSEQAELQVGFASSLAKGLRTQGTKGIQTPNQALGELLKGTGLEYHFVNDQTVVIREKSPKQTTAVPARTNALRIAQAFPNGSAQEGESDVSSDARSPLAEIVVSARYRDESIQSTPLAITAVSGNDLIARGGVDVTSVARTAPNMFLESGGTALGKSASISIRGIGEGDYNFAVEPAVGMYVDDVYQATTFGSLFDLLDVDRVEVLRGPQGTLFGKNSLGGVVRLITNQPKGDDSASLRFTGGSYNRVDIRGHMDLGLIDDRLALRIAGNMRQRDGYMKVVDFACAHPDEVGPLDRPFSFALRRKTTASDCVVGRMGGEDVWSGRATLKAILSDALTLTVSGDYSHDGGEAAPLKLLQIEPTLDSAGVNAALYIPSYGIPYDSRFKTSGSTTYANFSGDLTGLALPNISEVDSWGMLAKIDWTLSDTLAFKSITAYRTYEGVFARDGDSSPLDVGGSRTWLTHEQLTQELRLSGAEFGGRVEWTLGGYYFDGSGRDRSEIHIPELLFVPPIVITSNDPTESRSYAAYAHSIFAITSKLNLSAGLRYSKDEKDYTFFRGTIPGNTLFGPVFLRETPANVEYDRIDWKLGADYRLTDDVMVYAQAATGYRAGGFNPRPLFANQITPVYPEELTTYEAGLKADFFDHVLRLDTAVFTGVYKDLQLTASAKGTDGIQTIVRTNVGRSRVQGVELEAFLRPATGLQLSGAVGYVKYKYLELGTAATVSGGPCLGCVPPRVPKWTYSLTSQYSVPLGKAGELELQLEYSGRTRVYFDLPNTPVASQGAIGLLNARVGWTSLKGDWSASLGATNLTDKAYFSTIAPQSSAGISGTPGRPREYIASLERRF